MLKLISSTRIAAAVLFCATYLAYASTVEPKIYNLSDNFWYVPTAQSLINDGNLELWDEYADVPEAAPRLWSLHPIDGGWYNYFPAGTSVLIVPVVLAGDIYFDHRGVSFGVARDQELARHAAALLASLSVLLLFGISQSLGVSTAWGLILASTFAFATTQLSIHSSGLWSHSGVVLMSLAGVRLLVQKNKAWLWLSVFPLCFAFFCRPTAAAFALMTCGYLLWIGERSQAVRYLAGAVVSLACLCGFWWSQFGTLFPPYYFGGNFGYLSDKFGFRLPEALLGHLVSPNRGLFVFAPVLALSVLGGIWGSRRDRPYRKLFSLLVAWAAFHWLFISTYPQWWAGHCFGPRLFSEVIGVLAVLLVPFSWWTRSTPAKIRIGTGAFVLAAAMGFFVNARGAYVGGAHVWNAEPVNVDVDPSRVWDIGDLQFLRASASSEKDAPGRASLVGSSWLRSTTAVTTAVECERRLWRDCRAGTSDD